MTLGVTSHISLAKASPMATPNSKGQGRTILCVSLKGERNLWRATLMTAAPWRSLFFLSLSVLVPGPSCCLCCHFYSILRSLDLNPEDTSSCHCSSDLSCFQFEAAPFCCSPAGLLDGHFFQPLPGIVIIPSIPPQLPGNSPWSLELYSACPLKVKHTLPALFFSSVPLSTVHVYLCICLFKICVPHEVTVD